MRTRLQSIGLEKRELDDQPYEPSDECEESSSNGSDDSRGNVKMNEKRDDSNIEKKEKKEKKLPKERKKRSRIEKVAGRNYRPSAFQSRCSPAGLQKVCGRLSEEQKQMVKDMGFGGVLDVKCNTLDRVLCLELVDSFDLQTYVMWCRGQKIPVTAEEVASVFDLPLSGLRVPTVVEPQDDESVRDVKGLSNNELVNLIFPGQEEHIFKRAFLLYVLSIFFCPTTFSTPSPKLLGAVVDIDNTGLYHWGEFILEWLVQEIQKYKKQGFSKKSVGGCTFVLMIIYFHHRPLGEFASTVAQPLVKQWTNERLNRRLEVERSNELGLLHSLEAGTKPSRLMDIFKHEVTRAVYKEMMDVLKRLDDSLLAGKYIINPFMAEMRTRKGKGLPKEADDAEEDSLNRGHSRPSTAPTPRSILLRRLYAYCTSSPSDAKAKEELLVSIQGHFLTRGETSSLCPGGWINNAVVNFAAVVINEDEAACNSTARWCLKSYFTDEIAGEVNRRIDPHKSPLKSLSVWFDVPVGVEYEMIFAPVILRNHWWCYAFHRKGMTLYILDSLHSVHDARRASLDRRVAVRFLQNLRLHEPTFPPGLEALPLKHLNLPKQGNDDDCGVFTMKYMELWDPMRMYDGDLPMPNWTEADILDIRQELLLKWMLDERNELRDKVLKDSDLSSLCSGEPSNRGSGGHDSHTAPSQKSSGDEGEFLNRGTSMSVAADGEPSHYSNDNMVSTPGDDVRDVVDVLVAMPGEHAADEGVSMVPTPVEGVSDAMEVLASGIGPRQKTRGRKRGKGPQTRTPYTALAYKRKRK